MSLAHQDLKVVILRKSGKEQQKFQRKRGETTTITKQNTTQFKKALDENLDTFKVDKVSHSLKIQIQKARTVNKLSQKELAQKLNVTPSVIQSYENGNAIPDSKILQKLRRILKVKLTVK